MKTSAPLDNGILKVHRADYLFWCATHSSLLGSPLQPLQPPPLLNTSRQSASAMELDGMCIALAISTCKDCGYLQVGYIHCHIDTHKENARLWCTRTKCVFICFKGIQYDYTIDSPSTVGVWGVNGSKKTTAIGTRE
ncbi:predicted protein [Lichtheimia corymbifera JMRC:FSU:9682]|uniref:Uncharacterized protein n=1 Tax=Lichtheimia corymbifera JMRC:FSU:9682 TaxID=1263082 RepID=A0A068S4J1_9FUNG|nr:predicted protein [Lichtheimia corymbifera JMRC:FSU:9682]